MAMTEDLALFFDTDEFADSAVWTPAGGSAQPAAGVIFDRNGVMLQQFDVQSSGPTALCPKAQWPTVKDGDALAIALASGTEAFVVRSVLPLDDGAFVLLALAAA